MKSLEKLKKFQIPTTKQKKIKGSSYDYLRCHPIIIIGRSLCCGLPELGGGDCFLV